MGFIKEFRDFASRGNVVDLAVGIVIGGAFGKIVSSVVSDIIMPPVGLLVGGINFTEIKITLKEEVVDTAGKVLAHPVTINIGSFLQTILDFFIIAFAVFLVVKAVNKIKAMEERLKQETPITPEIPTQTEDQKLLTEIRDLLKSNRSI